MVCLTLLIIISVSMKRKVETCIGILLFFSIQYRVIKGKVTVAQTIINKMSQNFVTKFYNTSKTQKQYIRFALTHFRCLARYQKRKHYEIKEEGKLFLDNKKKTFFFFY